MSQGIGRWLKHAAITAGAAFCLLLTTGAQPATAQISIQVPFVSVGIGAPAYYPYYYPYYGYPYYYRTHY
ncbi:MAG TPA: hypothetical protein VFQ90_15115 [Stellaceae bacterium]|jgi:hypothetical protein|nr:hypothetical protein [Stellaceae bacterium]